MNFAKAHAYGNDFLYVIEGDVAGVALDALARELCHRHTGIGADGLIVYEQTGPRVAMRLFNADGSRAELSGNGLRALAALVLLDYEPAAAEVTVSTESGVRHLARTGRDGSRQLFRAAMGLPSALSRRTLDVAGETLSVVRLDIGNPHCVVLGALPDQPRFHRIGEALERHPLFLQRTNVEFVHVERPDLVRMLVWERGVGATASSGTGSCAALVAAAAFGGADRRADVAAPGGTQHVEWLEDAVYLTGWAEVLCQGRWLRPLASLRHAPA
jgi:diaminopimelate epimerase